MEKNATFTMNSWETFGPYPRDGFKVPESCCAQFTGKVDECRKDPLGTEFNVTGCFNKLDKTFQDNKSTFLIAGIVTMVIMVSN